MNFQNYKQVLDYCSQNKIEHVLLRYPHVLPREIHDLDLLIGKKDDYRRLLSYLQSERFICLEKESFRGFWAKKIGKELVVLDIYNRIGWLGWTMLDKNQVLARKKKLSNGLLVCSDEDELLIYLAQALFKNNGLNAYKTTVVRTLMKQKLDWNYLVRQMKRHGWLIPGKKLLASVRKNDEPVKRTTLDFVDTIVNALTFRRTCILFSRSIQFLFRKNKTASTTICLLGPDGSGKSTLAESLKQGYELFFRKFTPKINILYFGWKPFLPSTKLLSSLFKKRKYNVVEKVNTKKKGSFFQYALFIYFFLEYLARYTSMVFSHRKEKRIIIVDRYFYDIYAHYQDAEKNSFFRFLLKLFPKPDYTFVLDVPVEKLLQRKREMTKEQLLLHQQKYQKLQKIIPLHTLDTAKSIENCKEKTIDKTWRKISRRIK